MSDVKRGVVAVGHGLVVRATIFVVVACFTTIGCSGSREAGTFECSERTVKGAELQTAIVGSWEGCPQLTTEYDQWDGPSPTHYCHFRNDGTWLEFRVDSEGTASEGDEQTYVVTDSTLELVERGALYTLVAIEETALAMDTGVTSPPYRLRAVERPSLP